MAASFQIPSDIAFTPSVQAVQARLGSRSAYRKMEESGGWETEVHEDLAAFIHDQTSFFLATANKEGQPYIQHRGGPKRFLRVLDPHTLAFADFRGNRQYISVGNLTENAKVHLFLIDYAQRTRIKIWGEARVIEDDPKLLLALTDPAYKAKVERALVIRVLAWDANCPQHIPQLIAASDVAAALAARDERIRELEGMLEKLRATVRA